MHREAQLRGTEDRGGVVFVGKLSPAASAPVLVLAGLCSHYAPTKAGCTNMYCTHRSPLSIGSVSLIIYKGFPRLCDGFGSAPPTEDTKLLGAVTAHPGFAMANRVTKRSPCCTRFPDSSHHHRERRKARVPPGRAVDVVRVV